MTHPIVLEAVAKAHRDDLLRAAARSGSVATREQRRRRIRLASWLKAQLHHPTPAKLPRAVSALPTPPRPSKALNDRVGLIRGDITTLAVDAGAAS